MPFIYALTLVHFSSPALLAFQMFIAASIVCRSLPRGKIEADWTGWLALYLLCTLWAQKADWSSAEEQVRFTSFN